MVINARDEVAGLILAAGKGTRFEIDHSYPRAEGEEKVRSIPKVLRPILGRPMISYVIDTLRAAGVNNITLVVGYLAQAVMNTLGDGLEYVIQKEQRGSGDAVRRAKNRFRGFEGALVVMCGDSPLFRSETVRAMIEEQRESRSAAVLATATLDDPTGYGRIVRDEAKRIVGIVEERCAAPEKLSIKEVNGGAYVFDSRWLFSNLNWMVPNQTGEYNLTDMVRIGIEQGRRVTDVKCDPEEILGVNTPEELSKAENILRNRMSQELLDR
ncbi:MAG: NTP transferase domain-containing protein [Armatimonadetes bacterium]|nr:NTP transferase domain-containing protein [Armatimonadota bacterium]